MKRGLALVVAWAVAGCAPSLPEPYLQDRAAAERAYASGRYEEAARHWRAAYQSADKKRDRAEALYRQAASLRRAGQNEDARRVLEELLKNFPKSSRAARAAYDVAQIEIDTGDPARGYALLEQSMVDRPASGLAPRALVQYASWLQDQKGGEAALAWLESLDARLGKTELGESIAYAKAKKLDELDHQDAALAAYLWVADHYPYPDGAYWDDALWYAAKIEKQRSHPAQAVELLERMLHQREPSHLQGSYEKPRYAEAQFEIAKLYRDALNQPGRAMDAFHQVYASFPTTLLRDDALWQEALLARKAGDGRRVCSAVTTLAKELPDSRYAPCARALCPSAPTPKGSHSCHAYVLRDLEP